MNQKILIPMADPKGADFLIKLASSLTVSEGRITIANVVKIPEDMSLSEGAILAKEHRRMLTKVMGIADDIELRTMVRISRDVWEGIVEMAEEESPDLMVLGWKGFAEGASIFGKTIDRIAKRPPCDIAVVKKRGRDDCKKILLPVRGGPNVALSLSLAKQIAKSQNGRITAMYIMHPSLSLEEQEREKEMFHRFLKSSNIEMDELAVVSSSVIDAILKEAEKHDLVVMGASAATNHSLFGKIPEAVARSAKTTVIVVKKKDRIGLRFLGWPIERSLSVMVDKWFAENTFHHIEFKDIESLCRLKEKRGVKISLALPTKNEARTIGKVVETIKLSLMEEHQLVDEIVVIDARSKDRTVEIAKSLGIPVYFSDEILKPYGDFGGKGEALWKSLYVLKGDIIVWIDTDIKNIHPKFVYGLIGPLLKEERIKYVKGFYRRPLKVKGGLLETGGGRVTEISVRPLLNLFFPELSGLIQPLSGEYAGRREILESLPFFCGYGVEIGLLIDIFKRYGLNAIAQVDLEKRIHRNQPLVALSMMSFGIIQAILKRLKDYYGMDVYSEINKGMKLIHYEPERYFLKIREIEEKERLPIIEIPEYRGR